MAGVLNRPVHVLFVDDDEGIRSVGRLALERVGGMQVTMADGGKQALQLTDGGFVPDVVLLDMMMPEMDGLHVLMSFRSGVGPIASVPVIMLTARVADSDLMRYQNYGVDGVISKPFNPIELPNQIDSILQSGASGSHGS